MEKTLVILAAGMGRRYGGEKQLALVGPHQEIMADYAVYDAYNAGFTKVIFVIRPEHLNYFATKIIPKYPQDIKVLLVCQSLIELKQAGVISPKRSKMLGTGQALLAAKKFINGPFLMVNADDFYGSQAYAIASSFLDHSQDELEYLSVNYPLYLTLSSYGKVNRGIVELEDDYITNLKECAIFWEDGNLISEERETKERKIILKNQPVSLNFFVFKPSIWTILETEFADFIKKPIDDEQEFLLTNVLKKALKEKKIKFKGVINTSLWLGLTYKEDLEEVKKKLLELIKKGEYPEELWK